MRSSNMRKSNIRGVFEELLSLIDIGPGFLIAGATQCLAASSASTGKPSSNGDQMLQSLRPPTATDLAALGRMLESQPISDLLPSKLSEPTLLSLALDLRRVELMVKGGDDAPESLSVAIYLVMKYLMHLSSKNKAREFSIQEETVFQAVQILSITVEREIVTRIVGVSDEAGDEYLLSSLRAINP